MSSATATTPADDTASTDRSIRTTPSISIGAVIIAKKKGSPAPVCRLILLIASVAAATFFLNYHTPESAPSSRRLNVLQIDPKTVLSKNQPDNNDRSLMCQLLPQVPDDLPWIPVRAHERGPHCSSYSKGINLSRCCVGQCRQFNQKITRGQQTRGRSDFRGLFMKPHLPDLVSMPTMLEHLHYFVQQKSFERSTNSNNSHHNEPPIDTCVLWYIGRSLSQDQAAAAICKLTSLGYEIPDKKKCGIDDKSGLLSGTCELASQSSQHCPKIRVRHDWQPIGYTPNPKRDNEAGPIIYNYGVHANSLEAIEDWMENGFRPLYDDFQANDDMGRYPFMWREHEPQHFATKDGTYGGSGTKCQGSDVYDNYRNEAAIRYFEREGLQDKIPVIKSFNALTSLHGFHLGKGDCTHYCYSPWRFDLTWHGIALGLQKLPEQQAACMQLYNIDA